MTHSGDNPPELRLVLADDHQLVRAGIRMLLESVPGWRVVAEAGDGDAALREVLDHRPDILVLDLGMPGRPSLGLLPEMRARRLTRTWWWSRCSPIPRSHGLRSRGARRGTC